MKKFWLSVAVVFCLGIWVAVSQEAEVRTWTDSTGQYSTLASFDRVEGTRVVLLKDGEVIELQLSKLSAADQEYVKQQIERVGGSSPLPGAVEAGAGIEAPVITDSEKMEREEGAETSNGANEELSAWEKLMEQKGSVLFLVVLVLGIGLSVVGQLLFLVGTFSQSVGWGLACLFLPFAAFIFLFCHWDKARGGVVCQLLGLGILLGGGLVIVEMSPSPEEARDTFKEGAVDGFRAGSGLD